MWQASLLATKHQCVTAFCSLWYSSGSVETVTDTFWERSFGEETNVVWFRFQQSFLTEYDTQLKSLFTDEYIPWLLDMLHDDIFGGAESISKDHFMQVCVCERERESE